MQLLGSILLWFSGITGCSDWFIGQINMSSGDSFTGNISYCLDQDLVLINAKEQTLTFSPVNVNNFVIFDKNADGYRVFYSLDLAGRNGYKRRQFFELHFLGNISLFSREYEIIERLPEFETREGEHPYITVKSDKFYIVNHQAEVYHVKGSVKDVVQQFHPRQDAIKNFIRKENIELKSKDGLIALLTYYEQIKNGDEAY